MTQIGDLARGWSDALVSLCVGSTAIIVQFFVSRTEKGGFTVSLPAITEATQKFESLGPIASLVGAILFVGVSVVLGSSIINFGELIAAIREGREGHKHIKNRIEAATVNPIYTEMYRTAYLNFRALCGFGGLIVLWSFFRFLMAMLEVNFLELLFAFGGMILGLGLVANFARGSFLYFDWIVFGKFRE